MRYRPWLNNGLSVRFLNACFYSSLIFKPAESCDTAATHLQFTVNYLQVAAYPNQYQILFSDGLVHGLLPVQAQVQQHTLTFPHPHQQEVVPKALVTQVRSLMEAYIELADSRYTKEQLDKRVMKTTPKLKNLQWTGILFFVFFVCVYMYIPLRLGLVHFDIDYHILKYVIHACMHRYMRACARTHTGHLLMS
jgi:hypothetical protein